MLAVLELVAYVSLVDVPLAMVVSSVVVVSVVVAQAPSARQRTARAIRGVFFIVTFFLLLHAGDRLQKSNPVCR